MVGADDDNAAWTAQFAELLARQAAAAVELLNLISAEAPDMRVGDAQADDGEAGDGEAWLRSAERLEALWRQFLQDQSETFVAAWPDFVRNLTSLLPLLSRGQPLFVMLAQLLPLLTAPEVLRRAIESGGESLVKGLEHFLADLPADPGCAADGHRGEDVAGDHSGPDRTLP